MAQKAKRRTGLLGRTAPVQVPKLDRVTQVSVTVLAVIALLWMLQEARIFLMPTVLGCLIALAATPFCALIERTGLPSSVSALLVTATLVGSLGTLGWYMVPSIDEWRYRAPEVALTLERKLRRLESRVQDMTEAAASVAPDVGETTGAQLAGASGPQDSAAALDEKQAEASGRDENKGPAEQIVEGGRRMVVNVIAAAPEILGAVIYAIFLVYFLMAERNLILRGFMRLARTRSQAARIGRTLMDTRTTVGLYLATVTSINVVLGIATGLAFWAIGMPAPILFGVGMGLMNFMPYLGPLAVQAAAFAVAFVTFDTTTEAFYPVLILLAFNTVEGQFLTPLILGRRISVSPLAVFMAVTFGAWVWGAVGAIVATPALIVITNFVRLWAQEARRDERIVVRREPEAEAPPAGEAPGGEGHQTAAE